MFVHGNISLWFYLSFTREHWLQGQPIESEPLWLYTGHFYNCWEVRDVPHVGGGDHAAHPHEPLPPLHLVEVWPYWKTCKQIHLAPKVQIKQYPPVNYQIYLGCFVFSIQLGYWLTFLCDYTHPSWPPWPPLWCASSGWCSTSSWSTCTRPLPLRLLSSDYFASDFQYIIITGRPEIVIVIHSITGKVLRPIWSRKLVLSI